MKLNLRSIVSFASLALVSALPVTAHADVLTDYSISGTLAGSAGTYSGSFTMDQTTGNISSSAITVVDGSSYLFNTIFGHGGTGNSPFSELILTASSFAGAELVLNLPGSTPDVGYAGGVCTDANSCGGNPSFFATSLGGAHVDFATGPATPAISSTPEPSGLVLLGTGILGVAGAARRRFLNR